tara:strand:+ start:4787 stop:5533 length:747 start_codon:yes stop_codon:yes gene_type:complete
MVDFVNSGAIQGPSDGVSQDIRDESSVQQGPVGALRELNDGRRFRYAYFASATAAGLLVSQDVSATAVVETDNIVTAADAGATKVTITDSGTLGSATADQYAGAYLHITDDAGEGYTYRIRGNTAASSNAVDFNLYDGLVVAVTTATDVGITGSLWGNVHGATAGTDYIVSGVTHRVMQANYYGWVQTTGICTILADGSIAIGDNLTLSDGVAGAVQLKDAETEPLVGQATFAPDNTGHVGVRLYGLE